MDIDINTFYDLQKFDTAKYLKVDVDNVMEKLGFEELGKNWRYK